METFGIQLSEQQLQILAQPDAGVQNMLTSLFEPETPNYQALAYELHREFRQGGSPDVIQIAFDRLIYNTLTGKGSFRVVLDIRFTFGCEDSMTEKKDQTSEWTFTVDADNQSIRFYSSPFAESRSTADEF